MPLTTERQLDEGISGGEGFQKVLSLVYSERDPSIVYLGSDASQIWKSTDGGHSWMPKSDGYYSAGARSILVSPLDENLVLAAGTLGRERNRVKDGQSPLQGIFLSRDGAATWRLVHKTDFYKQDTTGALCAVDSRSITKPSGALVILCGTYDDGLLISDDSGESWSPTVFGNKNITAVRELPGQPGVFVVAADGKLYRYSERGSRIIASEIQNALDVATSNAAPERIYVAAGSQGVYRSDDGGQSFKQCVNGLPLRNGYFSDIDTSDVDANVVYLATHRSKAKGPFFSSDGCAQWERASSTNSKGLITKGGFFFSSPFATHPTLPKTALTVSNGVARVLKTNDGGEKWYYSGSGYTGARVRSVARLGEHRIVLALTDHGIWYSTRDGVAFEKMRLGARGGKESVSAIAVDGELIVASTGGWKNKHLIVSRDGGKHWTHHADLQDSFDFIGIVSGDDAPIFAGPYRSVDGGKSWEKLSFTVRAVAGKGSPMLVGTGDKSSIAVSIDSGNSWQRIRTPKGNWSINDLAVSESGDTIFVASNSGVFIYQNDAWDLKDHRHGITMDGHGYTSVKSIAVDSVTGCIFIGRWAPGKGVSNGIFRSCDNGDSWTETNVGIGKTFNVWSLSALPTGEVYAGTTYGLFVRNPEKNK